MDIQSPLKTIQFIRGGRQVAFANVPPSRTLLELLREDGGCTGTKEGCGEGDCGACTVVLGEVQGKHIKYQAINSCIRLAHSVDGMALWTVEDLASADGTLHPAQQSMVDAHASQCGFCTPGFVMSLFGMYQNHVSQGKPITRELAQHDLSGNLCRCTGYRPILDAAQQMATLPAVAVDEARLHQQLQILAASGEKNHPATSAYMSPTTLADLLASRAAHPAAQLVAGCTDVGLWVTKMHMQFGQVLDVTKVKELRRIESYPQHIAIGAAVCLSDAFGALIAERPQLANFAARFAGLPVRNSGTLGGNVANGSPIGDSMPLLIALQANVVLMSWRAGQMVSREMPLEDLYTGYRKTRMAADEVLAWIKVPRPLISRPTPPSGDETRELLKVYKISKRYDDDISAVCLAIQLHIQQGVVISASIGAGGVAATPVRAVKTQVALTGQPWSLVTVQHAMAALRAEFQPISDMRASGSYRSEVLGNLLQRFWLESQGLQQINLESFVLEEEETP
jgi:xanthine dehydrogenase small subunit